MRVRSPWAIHSAIDQRRQDRDDLLVGMTRPRRRVVRFEAGQHAEHIRRLLETIADSLRAAAVSARQEFVR